MAQQLSFAVNPRDAVLRRPQFVPDGWVLSTRRECHYRPIRRFVLGRE